MNKILTCKWRPKIYKEFFGQKHIINIVKKSINSKKLHKSYIIYGPSGVGKTTFARIFSKSLNCIKGISFYFCNLCKSCKFIDKSISVDCVEIDGADNRGVDQISLLMEKVLYPPFYSRFKIYIIDEFHMLSLHAFSLMLKLLEESPSYVKFILITTDISKIPVTVLSRCFHLNFFNISSKNIYLYICSILIKENIKYNKKAINLLAHFAKGNMREGVTLIQQCICNNYIGFKVIYSILCIIDEIFIIKLLFYIFYNMNHLIIKFCNNIKFKGFSFINILFSMINILHKISMLQYCFFVNFYFYNYKKEIIYFAKIFNPEKIHLVYQISVSSYNEFDFFFDDYMIFTIILLRMSLFKPIFNFN